MAMNPKYLRPKAKAQQSLSGTPASMLLHFDGDFSDSSPSNVTVDSYGVVASENESKFGGYGGYFDGGSTMLAPASASVSGTGDFTVEAWLFPFAPPFPNEAPYAVWLANETSGGFSTLIHDDGMASFGRSLIEENGISTIPVTFDAWNHVAIVRKNSIFTLFVNGEIGYSGEFATEYNSGDIRIGSDGGDNGLFYAGYIDDLRIVNGLAVYTGPFTPPAAPLTAIATPQA
jgi:hypothetical protein